jgi:hypothetical protein
LAATQVLNLPNGSGGSFVHLRACRPGGKNNFSLLRQAAERQKLKTERRKLKAERQNLKPEKLKAEIRAGHSPLIFDFRPLTSDPCIYPSAFSLSRKAVTMPITQECSNYISLYFTHFRPKP